MCRWMFLCWKSPPRHFQLAECSIHVFKWFVHVHLLTHACARTRARFSCGQAQMYSYTRTWPPSRTSSLYSWLFHQSSLSSVVTPPKSLSWLLWSIYCQQVPNLHTSLCLWQCDFASSFIRNWSLSLLIYSWPCKLTLTNGMQQKFQCISCRPQETLCASPDVLEPCPHHTNKPRLALLSDERHTRPSDLISPADSQPISRLVSGSLSIPASHKLIAYLAANSQGTPIKVSPAWWRSAEPRSLPLNSWEVLH